MNKERERAREKVPRDRKWENFSLVREKVEQDLFAGKVGYSFFLCLLCCSMQSLLVLLLCNLSRPVFHGLLCMVVVVVYPSLYIAG